ncbi:MAG: hypothetical protein Q7S42_01815 [Candidatus Omnitrophota bacterium]|nr:hypothetical protein [Candidatus Omnitrophota bacterium]
MSLKISVDTDCIISLFNPDEKIHNNMLSIDKLRMSGKINLYVSLKTIDQLSTIGGKELQYTTSLLKLPNYLIGTIGEQVGTIGSLAGTFGDAKRNEILQLKIRRLTREGVNIRDRQIVVDSYLGGMDILLTNDRGLRDNKSATNLHKELGLLVMSPERLLLYLENLKLS